MSAEDRAIYDLAAVLEKWVEITDAILTRSLDPDLERRSKRTAYPYYDGESFTLTPLQVLSLRTSAPDPQFDAPLLPVDDEASS